MIIYASSQSNELDRFVGKDVWIKAHVPKPGPKYNDLYIWIRILNSEYDDELKQEGYRVNICVDMRHVNSEVFNEILDYSEVFPKYYFNIVKPYDVLTTNELKESLS